MPERAALDMPLCTDAVPFWQKNTQEPTCARTKNPMSDSDESLSISAHLKIGIGTPKCERVKASDETVIIDLVDFCLIHTWGASWAHYGHSRKASDAINFLTRHPELKHHLQNFTDKVAVGRRRNRTFRIFLYGSLYCPVIVLMRRAIEHLLRKFQISYITEFL